MVNIIRKSSGLLLLIFVSSICPRAQGQTSSQLLEQAIVTLEAKHDFGDPSFAIPLKKIVADFPSSLEVSTARALLSSHYLAINSKDVDVDIMTFSDQVINGNPGTWQCALSLMNKMSMLNFQKKLDLELQLVLATLARTDLSPPSNISDPIFARVTSAVGGSSSVSFPDVFRSIACYIYLDLKRFPQARTQAMAVSNTDLRSELIAAITYAGG